MQARNQSLPSGNIQKRDRSQFYPQQLVRVPVLQNPAPQVIKRSGCLRPLRPNDNSSSSNNALLGRAPSGGCVQPLDMAAGDFIFLRFLYCDAASSGSAGLLAMVVASQVRARMESDTAWLACRRGLYEQIRKANAQALTSHSNSRGDGMRTK